MSSPRPQIAKQNRTRRRARTGKGFLETAIYKFEKNKSFAVSKKPFLVGRGELYSVLPPDEDAIWQSEVRLKVVAGGVPKDTPSDMYLEASFKF